jgi:riboflavin biosynthesis pyrimidine reductase
MGYLVRVELPWAVFGFVVGADGRITQAAPIAGWMEGKDGREVVRYWRGRLGAVVTWEAVA